MRTKAENKKCSFRSSDTVMFMLHDDKWKGRGRSECTYQEGTRRERRCLLRTAKQTALVRFDRCLKFIKAEATRGRPGSRHSIKVEMCRFIREGAQSRIAGRDAVTLHPHNSTFHEREPYNRSLGGSNTLIRNNPCCNFDTPLAWQHLILSNKAQQCRKSTTRVT